MTDRRGKMAMTVEEAEKLMCPFGGDCVAYQCMAWRWFDPAIKNEGYCGLAGKEVSENA
jgi:hypothetical protein